MTKFVDLTKEEVMERIITGKTCMPHKQNPQYCGSIIPTNSLDEIEFLTLPCEGTKCHPPVTLEDVLAKVNEHKKMILCLIGGNGELCFKVIDDGYKGDIVKLNDDRDVFYGMELNDLDVYVGHGATGEFQIIERGGHYEVDLSNFIEQYVYCAAFAKEEISVREFFKLFKDIVNLHNSLYEIELRLINPDVHYTNVEEALSA